jgi:ADP-ribose pyrophosphatase
MADGDEPGAPAMSAADGAGEAPHEFRLLASETVYDGRIISLRRDTVAMPGGGDSVREVVTHPGAVAVVAIDDQDRVVLVRQYRHPVRAHLWELPAGLRDEDGEEPLLTAQRELAEEAQLAAGRWSLLATVHNSPGFSDEQVLVYLAEELSEVARPHGFVVEHEEADMTIERVPLEEAVQQVFDGEITNSSAVVGLLAAARARSGSHRLRPAD